MSSESSLVDPTHPALKWVAVPVALVRRVIRTDDLLHHGGVMAAATVVSGGFNSEVLDGYVASDRARLNRLLWRALGYVGAIAGVGALLYVIVPRLVLSLFFGSDYEAAATPLRWYGVAILAFVLAIVILNFELARDRTRYVYLFTAGSIVEFALLWVANGSPVGMVQVILVVNAALFGYGLYEVRR